MTTVPIGKGPDAAAYDPTAHLAFSSNGEGTLTVVRQEAGDKYTTSSVPTVPGARTMALDRRTHTVYLFTGKPDPNPPAASDGPRRRRFLPGSFVVVVVEPGTSSSVGRQ